ncbi:hypothetical protein EBT31_17830, partial [bacterium]|nr:hypothetical protein [bacterium]
MPLVSSSIPNLINGVSQQPAALRLASQAEKVINCMPSPVEGLKKRPPFQHVKKILTGSAGTGRPFIRIVDRDSTIRYMVMIRDQSIKVYDLDGTEKTVATPDGVSYLDVGASTDPSAAFRMASVADYSFIVNREKVAAMAADLSPVWGYKGMVFIRSAEYSTTYRIKVNGTEVAYTTAAAGGTVPDTVTIASNLAGTLATSTGLNPAATAPTTSAVGSATTAVFASTTGIAVGQYLTDASGHITKGARVTNVTSTTVTFSPAANAVIQNNVVVTFHAANYVVEATDYIVRISKADGTDYTLASADTKTGEATVPIKGVVSSIADLPTIAEHGFTVMVQGTSETNTDDYYVKFVASAGSGFGPGVWKETVAPGIQYKLDATTMPHVLVRETSGNFTFRKFVWGERIAGDASTASNPSFIGSSINNVTLFRNRLTLLADENVIMSASDAYERFFPETVQTVVDSDPIDLSTG